MDKTGQTGSTLQLVNGIALITTFFSVRCIWGAKMVGVHSTIVHMAPTNVSNASTVV